MQRNVFDSGGYVLHRIVVGGAAYSAWFDASGNMLDCEQTRTKAGGIIRGGRTVPHRCGHLREYLARMGRIHNPNQKPR